MDKPTNLKDEWELKLDKKLQELQQCQAQHNLDSCFKCNKMIDCTLRQDYVKSAYESMNKGSTGGFEF